MRRVVTLITYCVLFFSFSFAQELKLDRNNLFNGDWKFYLGDTSGASLINFNDENWRSLDLPHDWSIEGAVNLNNTSGNDGGYFPTGVGWYRKSFYIPSSQKENKTVIYFEGVYMNAEVFINGKSLGIYPYGYTSFSYDLSSHLNYGKNNLISVKVDNSKQKSSRWYTGSGIYRNVWLIAKKNISVAEWGVGIVSDKITEKNAAIHIDTKIDHSNNSPKDLTLRTVVFNEKGKEILRNSKKFRIEPADSNIIKQTFNLQNPKLWSPDMPNLYTAQVMILDGNKVLDQVDTKFGVRSIHFSSEKGFLLNGNQIKLNGGNVHHDNGSLGSAAYDRAEVRKVELLKSAGFNAVRTSHNPPSTRFLQACDSIGLLVIDESFDGWRTKKTEYDYALYFDQWAKKDVQAMVKRDRNHPSIIMWSIGNEIIERKDPEAVKTAKMLRDAVREIDQTRPVVSAMTTWDNDWDIFDPLMAEHDVAGYNYQLHRAPDDHKRVPSRVIVQTESYPRDAYENWKLVKENNFIIGDFVWTAIDYLGESGIGRWFYTGEVTGEHYDRNLFPWHGAYCGDIDLTGWRKPISYYRDLLYNQKPTLHLAVREPEPAPKHIHETLWSVWPTWESWTWKGYEGQKLQVEIYSSYPKVRLYQDGILLGEKKTEEAEKFKAIFEVSYKKGELKAVALNKDNHEVDERILKTAGAPSEIRMRADRVNLTANGQDLSYISIEIVDEHGTVCDEAAGFLNFNIEGPGELIGIDNGNLKDTDRYQGLSRKVWKGRALAIVKGSHTPGDIKLSVKYLELSNKQVIKTR